MKKALPIIAVLGVIAAAFIWGVGVRNKLVVNEENVSESWAQVENVYKRRSDLINEVVAAYNQIN